MIKAFSSVVLLLTAFSLKASEKFQQDRAAILGMAGEYQVSFNFEETVALNPNYQLKKPYSSEAKEVVKVVSDTGSQITLQHLLVVDDVGDTKVIKHWAQIWTYEDRHTLSYEGNMTWLPKTLAEDEVVGTWTQFVTQVDDSPRYKAVGAWEHVGNYSAWTSNSSSRPLPRREYTKRDDYDLLKVVNRHVVTPDGWVHSQDNRKFVRRNGANQSLCLEQGLNHYKRITEPDEFDKKDFAAAEAYWSETSAFWVHVREAWNDVLTKTEGPVHYVSRISEEKEKSLMRRMSALAMESAKDPEISRPQIDDLLSQHLR